MRKISFSRKAFNPILFVLLTFSQIAYGQTFTAIDAGFSLACNPAAAWADIDNDGDLDAFFLGADTGNIPQSHFYRNDGGSFTEIMTTVAGLTYASCDFADMDNDGDADLAISGFNGNTNVTRVYRNNGGFNFTNINAGLAGLAFGSIAWGDYDHDTYPDLLISGSDNDGYPLTYLYRNLQGTAFADSTTGLSGMAHSSLAWNDIDNDGDLDFAICGKDSMDQARTIIYKNNNGLFEAMGAGIVGLYDGMLSLGDYNNDAYADLLLSGTDQNGDSRTLVYKSDQGQAFNMIGVTFFGASGSSALWGDMNNDGALDIVVAGSLLLGGTPPPPPDDPLMFIYRNTGGDQFQQQAVPLDIPMLNHIALGDYDNDTDLDMLLTGFFYTPIGATEPSRIFRNDMGVSNIPPEAPANLSLQIVGADLIFDWDEAAANTTPQGGLNYNLRIGTQPGNMNVYSALADITTGFRRVVAHGNAGPGSEITLYDVPFGEYFASVQAIDHTYAGSEFSENISFTFLPTASFILEDSACVELFTEIIYTGNASPSAQYNWDFDGGSTFGPPTGPGPHFVSWPVNGLKTVSLEVIEDGMTSQTVSHDILVVNPLSEQGNISGPEDICQGTASTTYVTTIIPGAISYNWSVDPADAGEFSGSGQQVELVWNPDYHGTATITVQGVNVCGTGPVSDPKIVTVRALPEKPDTPQGPASLCQVPPITQYSTNTATFADEYIWQLFPEDAGELSSSGTTIAEISWDENFNGLAKLVVIGENACGLGPVSDTLEIEIKLSPVANAGEDQQIDYLDSAQLDGSASGGSGSYSYYWRPEELLIDHTVEDPVTIALELPTVFTLTVMDEVSSCYDEDQVTIKVIGGPLSVTVSANPDTICPGDSSELFALAGGPAGLTYSWTSDPPGFTANIPNPTVFPIITTTYYVEVSDGVEFVTDSVQVVVSQLPDPPGAINGPMEVCAGDEDILYSIEPVPNATRYIWSLADGMFGSSDSASILVSFADPYTGSGDSIRVWAANNCGYDEEYFSYILPEVKTSPVKPLLILGPDSVCTTTDTVTNYELADAVPLADSYEWKIIPEDAGFITGDGLNVQVHWVKNWEGDASIIARARNACGNSDWSDPISVFAFTCVGIKEVHSEEVLVLAYPNPANDYLFLEITSHIAAESLYAEITDLFGRIAILQYVEPGRTKMRINTSSLATGMYVLRITGDKRALAVTKFIVRH